MRVSRKISIYRAQRSQQGCSLSLGMLRLAEPPTGRARLRSSLKSPRNPITPFETSRVSTLHPGLYTRFREDAKPPDLPHRGRGTARRRWKEFAGGGRSKPNHMPDMSRVRRAYDFFLFPKNWSEQAEQAERRGFGANDPSAPHPQTDRLGYNRGVRVTRKKRLVSGFC